MHLPFRTAFTGGPLTGDTSHGALNELGMGELTQLVFAEFSWFIEEYHRGLNPFSGVERVPLCSARGQRNPIGCFLRTFFAGSTTVSSSLFLGSPRNMSSSVTLSADTSPNRSTE